MSQARAARIAGVSLTALWLVTALLAASSIETAEVAAGTAPGAVRSASAGAS
jgi:hypothetical protein